MAPHCYRSRGRLVLPCFFIFFISSSFSSHATDTLSHGESITDGQTLVSAGNIFELGFFTPGNSTYRYLGIWYRNISSQTVVWVANRESPITGFSGRLTFAATGDLVALDGGGKPVWSTNSSTLTLAPNNSTTVQLENTGNLVLQASDGTVLWQSFEHPTDTFIPGMRITLNKTSHRSQLFTSWSSPDDPAPGNYSLGLDPLGSAQIFIWNKGGVPRWRSGQWNGKMFIGVRMRPLYIYGFTLVPDNNQGIMYYAYTQYNSSLLRFLLDWDGVERTTMLVEETKEWEMVWEQPTTECEIYGKCGVYGVCSDGATPMCSCLKGFEPRRSEQWGNGNWSGGCVRRTPLGCDQLNSNSSSNGGDGFLKVAGVKLPDLSDWASTTTNEAGCVSACLSNCSCKAYAYASDIGCLTWGGDLIDIYQFPEGNYDLYVKLASSELAKVNTPSTAGSKSKLWKTIVAVCTLGIVLLILSSFLWWKFNARLKEKKGRLVENVLPSTHLGNGEGTSDRFSGSSIYVEENQEGKASELPLFTFDCVAVATDYFSDSNKLGQGGFGHVYKATLPGGEEVAVKRLSKSSGQGLEEFKNEVILISKLQHRNLVRLLGCCIQGEEKILVYEYLPNKSLDAVLFDPSKKVLLDWKTRFSIIEGIARGLLYLHRDSRLRIVHRDLKASNILLDKNMNPKISDFGMARIFGGDQNQGNTNRVVGTFGYMSPEYAMEGLFSVRSDVYSFGILVLEIVTGRKNSSFHHMENALNIVGYAWQLWNEDKAVELIDRSIRSRCNVCQVLRCILIGLLCVQDRASDRPDVDYVIRMMGSETKAGVILPMPKQPTFVAEGSPSVTQTMGGNKCEFFSTSDLTVTMLHGR